MPHPQSPHPTTHPSLLPPLPCAGTLGAIGRFFCVDETVGACVQELARELGIPMTVTVRPVLAGREPLALPVEVKLKEGHDADYASARALLDRVHGTWTCKQVVCGNQSIAGA